MFLQTRKAAAPSIPIRSPLELLVTVFKLVISKFSVITSTQEEPPTNSLDSVADNSKVATDTNSVSVLPMINAHAETPTPKLLQLLDLKAMFQTMSTSITTTYLAKFALTGTTTSLPWKQLLASWLRLHILMVIRPELLLLIATDLTPFGKLSLVTILTPRLTTHNSNLNSQRINFTKFTPLISTLAAGKLTGLMSTQDAH